MWWTCYCVSRTQSGLAIRQRNQHAGYVFCFFFFEASSSTSSEAKPVDLVQYGTYCCRSCLDLAFQNYCILICANWALLGPLALRLGGTSGRGLNFEGALKFDMGNIEVEDQARSTFTNGPLLKFVSIVVSKRFNSKITILRFNQHVLISSPNVMV